MLNTLWSLRACLTVFFIWTLTRNTVMFFVLKLASLMLFLEACDMNTWSSANRMQIGDFILGYSLYECWLFASSPVNHSAGLGST